MFIKEVRSSIIKNSRGERTLRVDLHTFEGKFFASAPSGKSKGKNEAKDYHQGKIGKSFILLNAFCKRLKHMNFLIKKVDDLKLLKNEILKFEKRHGKLGANATYILESVFLKGAAKDNHVELWKFVKGDSKRPKIPMPVGNVVGGGMHSKGKKPDFQEFLLVPNEKTFGMAISKIIRVYFKLKKELKNGNKKWKAKTNDENAWQINLSNEDTLKIVCNVAKKHNLRVGLDVAASTFCTKSGYYHYSNKKLVRDRNEQIDYMDRLIKKYELFYVEDPLDENDFSGFSMLSKRVAENKRNTLIVGDDLTVTDLDRLKKASRNSINAIIIKPNQVGSLLEVKKVVEFCKQKNIKMIFSHRSGETMDDALADYAIGFGADFIKTGAIGRERLIKLRRVMEIEKKLRRKF